MVVVQKRSESDGGGGNIAYSRAVSGWCFEGGAAAADAVEASKVVEHQRWMRR